jgi:hypothetical protein
LLAQARIVPRLQQVHSDKAERQTIAKVPSIVFDALDLNSWQDERPND